MGFAAVNTGNNLLFLIVSALLGFMTVSGILGWLNIRGLHMRVELPEEIYAGVATLVTVRLENAKRLSHSFLLCAKLLGNSVTTYLLKSGAGETRSFVHTFPQRGRLTISSAEICSPFPINFFVRCRRARLNLEFPVFPAPLGCAGSTQPDKAPRYGDAPMFHKGNDGELSRIADYTGNEPMKLIHWRLSAKFEEFKVKEMSATSGEPVMIEIDALPGRDLEERLSHACFVINRLTAANRPVGLRLRERVIRPALSREHRLNLLTELAIYGKD
jgi:uncharacterized protein (DUF58 family)